MEKYIVELIEEWSQKKHSAKMIVAVIWMLLRIKEAGGELSINNLNLQFALNTSGSKIAQQIKKCGIFDSYNKTRNSLSLYTVKAEILEKINKYES